MCGKDDAALGAQGRAIVDRNAFAFVQALAQPGGGQAVVINAGFVTSRDSSGSNRFVAGGFGSCHQEARCKGFYIIEDGLEAIAGQESSENWIRYPASLFK